MICRLLLKDFKIWDDVALQDNYAEIDLLLYSQMHTNIAILIEGIEGLADKAKLAASLKKYRGSIPIVLTCDDSSDVSLKGFVSFCTVLKMKEYTLDQSSSILIKCVNQIGKSLSKHSADLIMEGCNKNIKHGLNEIQFMMSTKHRIKTTEEITIGTTDKSWNLWGDTQCICSGVPITQEIEVAISGDTEMATFMLHQNVPGCCKSIDEAAKFLDINSLADLTTVQYLIPQSTHLILNQASLSCRGGRLQKVQFPSYLGKMSSKSAMAKRLRLAGASKLRITNTKTHALAANTQLFEIMPPPFQALENLLVFQAHADQKEKSGGIKKLKADGYWIEDKEANSILRQGITFK
jgi:hypothetical protein